MCTRLPAVAGRFYSDRPDECARQLLDCLPTEAPAGLPPRPIVGGILPHAGWMCSGAVAGRVIAAIAAGRSPETAVIFGAVHVRMGRRAAVHPAGAWVTPLGRIEIDAELSAAVLDEVGDMACGDADPHLHEHSIEVEVPFVQHAWPRCRLLPIMTPPTDAAHTVGAATARACRAAGRDVIFLGSTDLTHYGPSYGFTPQGIGIAGLNWARDVNDRRMIDLMLRLDAETATREADEHWNACGAGAIAATIAACRESGATRAALLQHTTSYEVLSARFREPPEDAVGYAGIVFH